MQFILKLFKALNSAQSPWQVTLAITLGMVAGLTPMSGIQTVVILFLAFVLNIHLGLFFVASALFAGVAYLFDPWFEQIGYALLVNEGLQGLWTAWYNNGVMRLSHFNNTLVLGSTAVALISAVPLYFLLGWIISHYRDSLGRFLEKYPRLGLFGILKAGKKKDPLFRWWGAGLFIGFAALIAAFVMIVADPLVKWALEKGATAALQRDVRIGSVDTHFAEGAVAINRLEIAGEKEGVDAVSMEYIGLDIALNALLFNKTHMEHVAIKGVGFDTDATLKKGSLKSEVDADGSSTEKESMMAMPAFELPDPKTLLKNADLKSLKVYDEAKGEISRIRLKWAEVADKEFTADTLIEYQKDYEAIKEKAASKDPQKLLELTKDVTAFKAKIDARKKRITDLQKEFDADQQRIKALSAKVKNAPTEDYNALKSKYTLDGSGAMNVVGLLFGEKIASYLAMAEKYYGMIEPHLQSEKVPDEAALPPRGTGRWVKFTETLPSPDLLIAETEIDGILKEQDFAAVINDISDNQKALGRALTFVALSDGPQISGLKINGEDNRLGDRVRDRVTFSADQFKMDTLDLSSMKISNSNLAMKGNIALDDGTVLSGMSHMAFSNAAITMENLMNGKSAEAVADVLGSISTFGADVTLAGTLESPKIAVSTDLDKKLSGALTAGVKKQAAGYQRELKTLLNEQMKDQLGAIDSDAGKVADINALAGDQSKMLSDLGADAGGLLKGGGSLKGLLPF